MTQAISQLNGTYLGEGHNHEGQAFRGRFSVQSKPSGSTLAFTFEASGRDGTIFHAESSLIGPNSQGRPALWVASSNHPAIFERELRSERPTAQGVEYVFGFGDKNDKQSFREEIVLEVGKGYVRYVYFWGMPGGEFAERSGCVMRAPQA